MIRRRTISVPLNRYIIFLFTLCGCSFFWAAVTRNNAFPEIIIDLLDLQLFESSDYKQQFTIQTEGCEIPAMVPIDSSIKDLLYPPDPPKCDDPSTNLLGHNKTHIWTKKEIAQQYSGNLTCCYLAFNRSQTVLLGSPGIDERVQYGSCTIFSDHIIVADEFVRVTCLNSSVEVYDQYFLFAPKKHFMAHNRVNELKNDSALYNILVMGIDSVSRLNIYRTMPKTVKFLKKNGAIELLGYNKVGDNTFPNLIPMLLGISAEELPRICLPNLVAKFDNCPFIWEWFKQAGYYTAFAEDSSWLGTFNYLGGGFLDRPTDYYPHTFISEAEKLLYKRKRNKYCLGDKYLYQMLLDYAEDLMATLKSSRLFGFFWETVMTHNNVNYPAVMDDGYAQFLERLKSNMNLEETILILLSDHGMRFGNITHTKQGRFEARLPFAFILAPHSFKNKYAEAFKNLKMNSNRLTTPYNVHATLNDLVNLDQIKNEKILSRSKEEYWRHRSISLFLPIPGNKTCQLAGISDHLCTCHKDKPISKESALVKDACDFLIKSMNRVFTSYEYCAELSIEKLLEAKEIIAGKVEDGVGWRVVFVVVRTRPGRGEFEATLRREDSGQWALAGQVSRLNLYGNQSHCVDDSLLKMYCYCVDRKRRAGARPSYYEK